MSRTRMPWHRGVGPIGLDLGAVEPLAMQVRLGPDSPTCSRVIPVLPDATLVERTAAAAVALRKSRFLGREVIVGLPADFVKMAVVRIPVLAGADGREAAAWEAAERTGSSRDAIIADAIPTGAPSTSQEGKEEQLLVSAPSEELTQALDHLIDAGFEPVACEPRFAAVARALSRRNRRDSDVADVRAVLHIDDRFSLMMVLRGDRVAFCREIATGGEVLDNAVATRLSVPVESARRLRAQRIAAVRGRSAPVDPVTEEASLAATRATLDALAGEVALCLRYFGVTFRGGQPARVVLSGPNGAEPRLASIIEDACRSSVVHCESELPAAAAVAALEPVGASQTGEIADWLACYGLACRTRSLISMEEAA
jgi:type IV pilus assembly protein PilM